ncbi:MAG: alpha/beta hydrolase [Pseudomonadota bacterium]
MGIETRMPLGADLDASLAIAEARFDDMRPGHAKEIIWAAARGSVTKTAVIYIHGFSASKGEMRPVPDRVAKALGANLFFTRLPGHGRNGRAMAETELHEWFEALDEALEIGRRIGERVVIMSCSTGCTLVTAGFAEAWRKDRVVANIMIAPNFGVQSLAATLAYLPKAEHWVDKVAGQEVSFEPRNEEHALWWTNTYPPSSIVPMMRLIKLARKLGANELTVPTLAIFNRDDQVVRAGSTVRLLEKWGASVKSVSAPTEGAVDRYRHVVLGDILSPANTDWGVETMMKWLNSTLR